MPEPMSSPRSAGVVTDRQVGPGQYIQAGAANPVFALGDLSTVWLVAAVPETDAPFIERGQKVEVRVLALPGRVNFEAKLTAIGAQVDPVTRRVPVRATLANPEMGNSSFSQMFLSDLPASLPAASRKRPRFPRRTPSCARETKRYVWVVGQNNTLALRLDPHRTQQRRHGRSARRPQGG